MNRLLVPALTVLMGLLFVQQVSWATEHDCSKVVHVASNSSEAKEIQRYLENLINKHQKEKGKLEFRAIEKVGKWIIAEVDFSNLEPGIFVLNRSKKGFRVVAEFGGYVEEEPEKAIRAYFLKKVPAAPKELFQCYTPKGEPFHREGE
jgi:Ribonuclease G/E